MLSRLFSSATVAHAHCDLYCGVYDPAQAKIEALSVVKTAQKYHESDDEAFRVWNMGIGLIAVIDATDVDAAAAAGHRVIGRLVASDTGDVTLVGDWR